MRRRTYVTLAIVGAIIFYCGLYVGATDNAIRLYFGEAKPVSEIPNDEPPAVSPTTTTRKTLYENTRFLYAFKLPADAVVVKQEEMEQEIERESKSIYVNVGERGVVAVAYIGDVVTTQDSQTQVQTFAAKKQAEMTSDDNPNRTLTVGDVKNTLFAGLGGYSFIVREQAEWVWEGKTNTIDQTKEYVFVEHNGKVLMVTYSTDTPTVNEIIDSFTFTRKG